MLRVKGILWAALSSSTFGLAPLFTLLLLGVGYSSFEVLTYRWGVASLCLGAYGLLAGCDFRLGRRELGTVFLLSLFRAATSLSLVIAYQNIASGVASTIHFMYPLVVAVVMMCFFRERGSVWTFAAIGMSIVGAVLLSLGNVDFSHGDTTLGIVSATVSVVASASDQRQAVSRFSSLQAMTDTVASGRSDCRSASFARTLATVSAGTSAKGFS